MNVQRALPFLLLAASAAAQMDHMHHTDDRPVPLVAGLGLSHHTIRTSNAEAQKYFDQGLDYIWAFNHEEARRSFQKAADLDPKAAMPLWGVALAVGPNYNDIDIGHVRAQQAIDALAKARVLAATQPERDYIRALSARYSGTGESIVVHGPEYSAAMKAVAASYPKDLDAATLYAESLMDLHPWKLWAADGSPTEGTTEIVSTLQGVLKRDPKHVGANHLLIHATEASPHPELALAAAKFLEDATPAAGHLVHMPAHTYQRTGNFNGAAAANQNAVQADRAYFKAQHLENVANMYDSMYYTHNMHFLASSCSMEGNNACTQRAAKELVDHVMPQVKDTPAIQWYAPTQAWMLARFQQWPVILSTPLPTDNAPAVTTMWHYARALAYIGTSEMDKAAEERALLAKAVDTLPGDFPADFNNPAKSAYQLALDVVDARMAEALNKPADAIAIWQKAVSLNDTFAYNEPADWYYPVRESLGGAYLRNQQPAEAEKVFRDDLKLNPGNPRSLYGLWQSLLAQHKGAEATQAEAAFKKAWQHADTQLTIASL